MPSARALKAGKGIIELSLLSGSVEKGLKTLQSKANAIGKGFKDVGKIGLAAGGAITSGFLSAATIFANVGDSLDEMSGRTSVSVETLGELGYAAEESGASLETVEKALLFMRKNNLDPAKFDEFAAAVTSIEDPTKRTQKAMELFGKKTGPALLPMLKDLQELRQEARDLALVMSTEDAKAGGLLADTFATVVRQVRRVAEVVGTAVAGPLTEMLNFAKGMLARITKWLDANRELVKTIFFVGLGISALGGILFAIGTGFSLAAFAAGGFITVAGVIASIFGAIVSPVGLVVAGLAGLSAWFLTSTDTGKAWVASLGTAFGELWGIAKTTFDGIKNALAGGDITLAATVLWAGLKLLWLQGTSGLRETWLGLMNIITKLWHQTVIGLASLLTTGFGNIERGWSHSIQFMLDAWTLFVAGFKKVWNSTVAFFQTTWLRVKGLFGADVADDLKKINDELAKANGQVDDSTLKTIGDRDKQSQKDRAASAGSQKAVLDGLQDDLQRRLAGTDGGTQKSLADAQKQLDTARSTWAESTKAAEAAKAAAQAQTEGAQAKLAPAAATVKSATVQAATSQTGIFDARFARQIFGGGGIQQKQLAVLERIEQNTSEDDDLEAV